MTHADYIDGKVTFAEYYRSVNKAAGLKYPGEHALVDRARKALANGDQHLNTIPIKEWDAIGANPILRTNLARAFKAHGDWLTLANIVCALKQAVRDAAESI